MNVFLATVRALMLAVFGSQPISSDHGMASRFGDPGDLYAGEHLSCTRQKMGPNQMVCAHRTLPCGTPIVVENIRNGRIAVCAVADRGPYGAIMKSGRWHIKRHEKDPGTWRGLIDLSPSMAKALAFNGFENVRLFYPTSAAENKRQLPLPKHKRPRQHHPIERVASADPVTVLE